MSSPVNPVKILLIDRVAMLREALHAMISQCEALRIIGDTGDPEEVVPLMEARHPGVLVFHLQAGDEAMINTMNEVASKADHPPMLVLTADTQESPLNRAALHVGASGLIEMREPKETLFKAIQCVHAGELWIDRRTTALVVQKLRQQRNHAGRDQVHPKDLLSRREKEIVALVASGSSTEAIAEQLFISEKTVRNHLVSIFAKLDVSNRIQLALCASKLGLG
ncbi:MAG: hypothetical protein RLZZ09_3608 [Pseudomonadota bacterium]